MCHFFPPTVTQPSNTCEVRSIPYMDQLPRHTSASSSQSTVPRNPQQHHPPVAWNIVPHTTSWALDASHCVASTPTLHLLWMLPWRPSKWGTHHLRMDRPSLHHSGTYPGHPGQLLTYYMSLRLQLWSRQSSIPLQVARPPLDSLIFGLKRWRSK